MALITQSTQPPWKFERLAAFMVGRAHELKIVNSVCPVTIRRQEDTVDLAREVEFIVVVGGRQSANTKELTRLCEIVGTPAIQVERAADLVDRVGFRGRTRGRRHRGNLHSDRGPRGRRGTNPHPRGDRPCGLAGTELAVAALGAAVTPAGRTTSLPGLRPVHRSRRCMAARGSAALRHATGRAVVPAAAR